MWLLDSYGLRLRGKIRHMDAAKQTRVKTKIRAAVPLLMASSRWTRSIEFRKVNDSDGSNRVAYFV